MPASAPIRLPEFADDLTPAEILHFRRAFPLCGDDYFGVCDHYGGRTVLTYLERRALAYDLQWVLAHGPPDRYSSLDYQRYMSWAVGRSFRFIAGLLERAEWVLLLSEERGCWVDRGYCPTVDRSPERWYIAMQG